MARRRSFKYGTMDIADAIGKSVYTVRRDVKAKVFDIYSLRSVAMYIAWRLK